MKNLTVTICILILIAVNSLAATLTEKRLITGQVLSEDSELGIPGVSISVEGFKMGGITNAEGKFVIVVPDEANQLVFSLSGFYDEKIYITEDIKELNVVLSVANNNEQQIVRNRVKNMASGTDKNNLYACLWDDLEKDTDWEDFMILLIDEGYDKVEKQWGIFVENRITIYVENANRQPLTNADVTLLSSRKDNLLWKATTDHQGKVEMWPDIFDLQFSDKYKAVVNYNGKEQSFKAIKAGGGVYHLIFKDNPVSHNTGADIVLTGKLNNENTQDLEKLNSIIKSVSANINSGDNNSFSSVFYQNFDPNGTDYQSIKDFEYANNTSTIDAGFEYALARLVEMYDWSKDKQARILFWAVDELPTAKYANTELVRATLKQAAAKGIQIVPIVTQSIDKDAEFFLRFVANATNGEYIFLTEKNNTNYIKPSIGKTESEPLKALLETYLATELGIKQL